MDNLEKVQKYFQPFKQEIVIKHSADFNNGKQNTSIDYKKFIAWLMLILSTFDIYIK